MANSKNDYEKHIEAFEAHLEALYGDRWEELTAKEICKLLAIRSLGLNGGFTDQMDEAADKIGFTADNVVPCGDGSYQVLAMVEFSGPEMTAH